MGVHSKTQIADVIWRQIFVELKLSPVCLSDLWVVKRPVIANAVLLVKQAFARRVKLQQVF